MPVLRDPDPMRRFARLVARFYAPQPKTVVAVTGTNGKTSVASFVRQIWEIAGKPSASIGTIGVVAKGETRYGNMTTPDPVTLHKTLSDLAREGIDNVAMEASSHGLIQRRLDGLTVSAGAFTNLSRDHLDYHGTMEAYCAAKMRLFDTVLAPGAGAVVNLDDRYGEHFAAAAKISGLNLMTVGANGSAIRILDVARDGFAQVATVDIGQGPVKVRVPLVGAFRCRTRWSRRVSPLRRAPSRWPRRWRRSRRSRERRGGSNSWHTRRRARRSSSTSPTRPRPSKWRWKR